jgi:predicted nucleic acid-binding protein
VFIDANTFIYHFTSHALFGPACRDLIRRIDQDDLLGFTSTHILTEVSHRMMMIEAANLPNWGASNVRRRLLRQPQVISGLVLFQNSVQTIISSKVVVLSPTPQSVLDATTVSQQVGLLSNDALVVAVMRHQGLVSIASNDSDFDRAAGITRYAAV